MVKTVGKFSSEKKSTVLKIISPLFILGHNVFFSVVCETVQEKERIRIGWN